MAKCRNKNRHRSLAPYLWLTLGLALTIVGVTVIALGIYIAKAVAEEKGDAMVEYETCLQDPLCDYERARQVYEIESKSGSPFSMALASAATGLLSLTAACYSFSRW